MKNYGTYIIGAALVIFLAVGYFANPNDNKSEKPSTTYTVKQLEEDSKKREEEYQKNKEDIEKRKQEEENKNLRNFGEGKSTKLDTSIEVTKEEMDKFIDVAKNYRLKEEDVKRLVQILKQCGVKHINSKDFIVSPISKQNITWAMGDIKYDKIGYKIFLSKEDIPEKVSGHLVLLYNNMDNKLDFTIYHDFNLDFGDNEKGKIPIYANHEIENNISFIKMKPTEEMYKMMYNAVRISVENEFGKVIDMKDEDKHNIDAIKNACYTNDIILRGKDDFKIMYKIHLFIVYESNVYGEGKKEVFGDFTFMSVNNSIPVAVEKYSFGKPKNVK